MRDQDFAVAKFVGSKRVVTAGAAAPAAKVNEKKEKAEGGAGGGEKK